MVELVSVQCSLADNQYHSKSDALYTFTPNKSYAYLLNIEPRSLVFVKTNYTEFDDIIMTFTLQNSRPLQIEEKVNLTMLINR